jgi:putative transposase
MFYHLVLVTKYRRKVLDDEIVEYLRKRFETISSGFNIHLVEMNHDKDHLHVLFKAEPNSELSKFINAYKSSTSRMVKKIYPRVTKKLWKSHFWSRSFCLITTGGAPLEVIKEYIQSQGEKHD